MLDMAMRQIVPSMTEYAGALAKDVTLLQQAGVEAPQAALLTAVSEKIAAVMKAADALSAALKGAHGHASKEEDATYLRDAALPLMYELGYACDALEVLAPRGVWPMPTYDDLLFYN
ncbi:hypothetical protein SDC9_135304 [bioreactor metagenome]|uniref:Glutamine synthetase n=1 Tax=bioreactor metagenome TaxID=1076179 RepID=A0A645DHA3_9ZZZZ